MRSQKARLPPVLAGIAQTWFFASSSIRANTLKPEPRKCSLTSCITIGLRRSGLSLPYLRNASAKGMRGQPLVTGLPLANSSNTPRDDRLHRREHVLLGRRSSSRRRAGRTRPAGGRRAGPRRGSTARSGSSGRSPPSSAAACTAAAPAAARRTCRDGCATAPGSRARLPASDAVRIGVWNSKKPCSFMRRRMRIDDRAARS